MYVSPMWSNLKFRYVPSILLTGWIIVAFGYYAKAQKPLVNVSSIKATRAVGSKIFFATNDNIHGEELWINLPARVYVLEMDGDTANKMIAKKIIKK
jgi:hypothetical protein